MDMASLAEIEDDWDDILRETCGIAGDGDLWATPFLNAANEVTTRRWKEDKKSEGLAKKMYEIVKEETALAKKERADSGTRSNVEDGYNTGH